MGLDARQIWVITRLARVLPRIPLAVTPRVWCLQTLRGILRNFGWISADADFESIGLEMEAGLDPSLASPRQA